MTDPKKTYAMWYPGKNAAGNSTFIEHPLPFATDRQDAKVMAMGVVRTIGLPEMYLVEEPGTMVFHNWAQKEGNG